MRQMAGKDEETSLEDSSFGPGHFKCVAYSRFWLKEFCLALFSQKSILVEVLLIV